MKPLIRTLVAYSISVLATTSCSMNRAESLRMLDRRADYDSTAAVDPIPGLKEGGVEGFRNSPVPVRTRAQVAPVWIFAHETGSRDYFWGGWISLVIDEPQWVLSRPGVTPKAPGIVELKSAPIAIKRASKVKPKPPTVSTSSSVNAPSLN